MKIRYPLIILFLFGLFTCTKGDDVPQYIDIDAQDLIIGRVLGLYLIDNQLIFQDVLGNAYWIDTLQKRLQLVCVDSVPKFYRDVGLEDEDYKISSCCRGEWGGSVFFEDKQTGEVYSTEITCLVNVDTFNQAYYLFDYLGHGRGSSSITKIEKVNALPQPDNFDTRFPCIWYHTLFDTEAYFKYRDSVKQFFLGDTLINKHLINAYFPSLSQIEIVHGFRNSRELKFLYVDAKNLNWGTLQNGKLKQLQVLTDTTYQGEYINTYKIENDKSLFVLSQYNSYYHNVLPKFNANTFLIQIDKTSLQSKTYRINFGDENAEKPQTITK